MVVAQLAAQRPGMARTVPAPEPPPAPSFLRELFLAYDANDAHAYWLHGNLQDIDSRSYTTIANLFSLFSSEEPKNEYGYPKLKMGLFITYNRATGFTLYGDDERSTKRELFLQLTGLGQAAPTSAAQRMLAQAQGSPAATNDPLYDNRTPERALPIIKTLVSQHQHRVAIVLEAAQTLAPRGEWAALSPVVTDTLLILRKWGLDYAGIGGGAFERIGETIRPTGHVLIGLVDTLSDLHEYVRKDSGWQAIEVGKPTRKERAWYLRDKLDGRTPSYRAQVQLDLGTTVRPEQVVDVLSDAVAGLRLRDVEGILLNGMRSRRLDRALLKDTVHRLVREQFTADGGEAFIDLLDPSFGLDSLGGYTYLTDYMRWRIRQFREGKLGQRGFLLMGPPGTGKSSIAQAMAYEAGYKAVEWKPALTRNKYVGETERQTSLVLQFLGALGKTLCLIEEVDVAMENRESLQGASGVGGSMLSLAMPFIADEQKSGDILWVATTNNIDGVDEAMKRPGRLGIWIPMVPPHPSDHPAIEDVLCTILEHEHNIGLTGIPAVILERCAWFTQAHLKALVTQAADLADREDQPLERDPLEYLGRASERYKPNTRRVEQLSRLAVANAQDQELIPPGYARPDEQEIREIKRDLAEAAPSVGPSGRL